MQLKREEGFVIVEKVHQNCTKCQRRDTLFPSVQGQERIFLYGVYPQTLVTPLQRDER